MINSPSETNPLGMSGIEFTEFASPDPLHMHKTFLAFGFSKTKQIKEKQVELYQQHDINLLLTQASDSFAGNFAKQHGPSICSMGWRVSNAEQALEEAVKRGAKEFTDHALKSIQAPAILGIGGSLIYFIDQRQEQRASFQSSFATHEQPEVVKDKGFLAIDHLTNNVHKGTMARWSSFYKDVFGFTEVRTFDIRGEKTGLQSDALRSPCGSFCIPINEGTEKASQIEEYLRDYDGPGIQHLAFLSTDLLASLDALEGSGIETLDINPEYYTEAFQRVPQITENKDHIRRHQALVDGDADGYLLQIFTKNLFGPIFIELIQRKNHFSFGEGNFQALFESIERDQRRRGML